MLTDSLQGEAFLVTDINLGSVEWLVCGHRLDLFLDFLFLRG